MKTSILHDWDGVFWNTKYAVFSSYSVLLGKPFEYVEKNFDPNWKRFIEKEGLQEPSNEEWDSLIRHFGVGPFPGGCDYLKRLHGKRKLALVTSSNTLTINSDLEQIGLKEVFDVVVTSNDVKKLKPYPEGLEIAVKKLNEEVGNCTYVGDAIVDAKAAKKLGMDFVGVDWGYEPEKIKKMKNITVAHNFDELYEIVCVL